AFPGEFSPEAVHEEESLIIPSSSNPLDTYEPAIAAIAAPFNEESAPSTIIGPADVTSEQQEDFDRQLDARIARVMRQEKTAWTVAPADEAPASDMTEAVVADEPSASKSEAVNSVLDRLREAGLWKGEGTAKADQFPSSNHPVDEGATGLCRLNQA